MVVPDISVEHQTGAVQHLPLHIGIEANVAAAECVGVGGVIDAVDSRLHLGDAVVAERASRHNVKRHLGTDEHIGQAERVVTGTIQVRVAVCHGGGRLDDGRIQVVDTRSRDACGKGQLEALHHRDLIIDAGTGHPVAEVGVEVVALTIGVLATEVAPLIAQSGSSAPLALAIGVTGIGRTDLCQVVEQGDNRVNALAVIGKTVVAAIGAVDILQSRLEGIVLGKGARPVELQGVLPEFFLAVVVGARVVNGHIDLVNVGILAGRAVA